MCAISFVQALDGYVKILTVFHLNSHDIQKKVLNIILIIHVAYRMSYLFVRPIVIHMHLVLHNRTYMNNTRIT